MKYILLIFLIVVVFSCKIAKPVSSTKVTLKTMKDAPRKYPVITDSLGYIDEIVANKQKYINQPFSVLTNDLKMPIKSYFSGTSYYRNKSNDIWVYFDNTYNVAEEKWDNSDKNAVSIIVEWMTPLSRTDIEISLTREAGEWTDAEQKYFKNVIVRDIVVPFLKIENNQ